jgi:hypothetical protein
LGGRLTAAQRGINRRARGDRRGKIKIENLSVLCALGGKNFGGLGGKKVELPGGYQRCTALGRV